MILRTLILVIITLYLPCDFALAPQKLEKGTQIIKEQTSSISIFEASHVKRRNMWTMLEQVLKTPLPAEKNK